MGANIQAYTSEDEVVEAVKKAAEIAGTSVANFAGNTLKEKVTSMGLLSGDDLPNLWGIISEMVRSGVPAEAIARHLEPLMQKEVCDE